MSETFHFSPRPNRAHEIRWRPWGPQAFAEAQAQDRPILLSLSAVWCHWCHVMDETTYSTPAIIESINEHFVPIRVDNDRRPDINARYNMGGWPTTAFLMPGGETITGATYLAPQQMHQLLERIVEFYRENAPEIRRKMAEEPLRRLASSPQRSALSPEMVERVLEAAGDLYDPEFGGFGTAPKFPMTDVLELLLDRWLCTRDARPRQMLEKTLHAMADGGMYDHVEGGWFRYSTDRAWQVPHFEKMAEDHAGLLRVCARFARVTGDARLRDRVSAAIGWLTSTLYEPRSGLFGGSQDADEVYYAKGLEERRAMRAPYVDRTSYTNWTAALAGALYEVAPLLDDAALAQRATRALDVLWERMHDERLGLLYHYLAPPDGEPQTWGLLTDQAAMLRALLDAHAATGQIRMLERAEQLADETVARLCSEHGGFLDRAPDGEALGFLALADRPLAENAAAADALVRLAALADRPDLREVAERALALHAGAYERAGAFAAPFARAVARFVAPNKTVTLVTLDEGRERAALELLGAAGELRLDDPLVEVRVLDAERDRGRLIRSGYAADERGAVAYVCIGTVCAEPARTTEEIRSAYRTFFGAAGA
ncbi:MAG TPA: DUF255 domain-containing protein [Candidatus Dormibacteraeota bacterium]|nr:DUF255 domain-containing protein [Candidatus Dormibacteraeota bacterium]